MTEETIKQILKFRDDRDWKQFHNPKDLAISISLEAAELLEVFQWSGTDVSNEGKQEKIKEELADVLNYCVLMADACGLDIDEIVQEKIKVNNEKYPVSKAKGKKEKYNKLLNMFMKHLSEILDTWSRLAQVCEICSNTINSIQEKNQSLQKEMGLGGATG